MRMEKFVPPNTTTLLIDLFDIPKEFPHDGKCKNLTLAKITNAFFQLTTSLDCRSLDHFLANVVTSLNIRTSIIGHYK